jgi:hypothetical protein
MMLSLLCVYILNLRYYFFNYLLNLDYPWHLYYLFDYILNKNRNFYYLLDNLLYRDYFLINNLNLLNLCLYMIDNSLYLHRHFLFNDLLSNDLHFLNLRHLFLQLDYLLNYCWHFNYCLNFFLAGD